MERDPASFEALHRLGLIALQRGSLQRAADLLARAVEARPYAGDAHLDLGIALCRLGRVPEGLARFDHAVLLMPRSALARTNQANALALLSRFAEALESSDAAIALDPTFAPAHNNRGNALMHLGRYPEALAALDRALALAPGFADAHFNRGVVLYAMGEVVAARESYDRALAFDPGHQRARWNLGVCDLMLGDYESGLANYESRASRAALAGQRPYAQPQWTGLEDLAGRTLFVYHELFLGDIIQFCRYLPMAEARGARVVLSAPEPMHALLGTLSPTLELIGGSAHADQFDYHIALLSLPHAFHTRLATIPRRSGYLAAGPERIDRWRQRLGRDGFRVGVSWEGDRAHGDEGRFFPPGALAPLAAIPGVRLVSLQKPGRAADEAIAASGVPIETPGADLDADAAFVDTAALMHSLDLVIACDSAVAHLAGALGRPAWVALKRLPDWRWQLTGDRACWYESLRLFRQQQEGEWGPVFAEMTYALRSCVGADGGGDR